MPLLSAWVCLGEIDMRLMVCAIVATAMFAGTAHAGDWRIVGVTENNINLIDASSVRATSSVAKTAWIAFIHGGNHEDGVDYTVVNTDFLCPSGMMRMTYLYAYRADGSLVNSFPMNNTMTPPPPDSVGADFVRAVCEDRYSETGFPSISEMMSDESKAAARLRKKD
jgi:hypothetical protein